jgi:hypothetical protein
MAMAANPTPVQGRPAPRTDLLLPRTGDVLINVRDRCPPQTRYAGVQAVAHRDQAGMA